MRKKLYINIAFLLAFSLIFISSIDGAAKISNNKEKIADYRWVKVNQMNMALMNYGIFGQTIGTDAGFYWPSGFPNETYIYGAGIWIGGRVRKTGSLTEYDTQVTCGYNPNSAGGEFVQGIPPNDDLISNYEERIYFSTESEWPLKDATGADSVMSSMDTYCTYNDYDSTKHFTPENKPLRVSVIQQTYAWAGTGAGLGKLKEDIFFFIFNIVLDPGADTVHDVFLGVCADNDIGNESTTSANDLVGFDKERNMAYQWQNPDEPDWAHHPGAIGFKFLQGPKSNGMDTVHYYNNGLDSIVIGPDDTLGMTAFKIFTIEIDPENKIQRYQVMSGYNYKTINPNDPEASYSPFDEDVYGPSDKRFVQTAGPFNLVPGDTSKVIYAVLMARDTNALPIKADVAQSIFDAHWQIPGPPDAPELYVESGNKKVSLYWENNAEFCPDKYIKFTENPMYKKYDFAGYKVYKSRYDIADSFKLLGHYDKPDGIEILRQDSLFDPFSNQYVITVADTIGDDNGLAYSYIDEELLYNGIKYYYAVTAYDANFENYTVDSLGDTVGTFPTSYESSISEAANMTEIIPQSNASNYTVPQISISYVSGNTNLLNNVLHLYSVAIVNDLLDETPDKYQIKFGEIEISPDNAPVYSMIMFNSVDSTYTPCDTLGNPEWIKLTTVLDTTVLDSTFNSTTNQYEYDTISAWVSKSKPSLAASGATVSLDTFVIKTLDNKVDSIVVTNDPGTPYNTENIWLVDSVYGTYSKINSNPYYNGGSYRITWHPVFIDTLPDSALTCDVYDIVNETEIPYSGLWEMSWRFGKVSSETNQGQYALVSSSTGNNWKWMYIAGTMILFNYHPEMPIPPQRVQPMIQANKPVEGEEWYIYTTGCPTPSIGNAYSLSITKGIFSADIVDTLLAKVSVVPNPYLVRNTMESGENESKIMFTNLPDTCNIYIYTLMGDMVTIIEHKDASGNGMEYWNVLTDPNLTPASGIYLYVVETIDQKHRAAGKFAVIK